MGKDAEDKHPAMIHVERLDKLLAEADQAEGGNLEILEVRDDILACIENLEMELGMLSVDGVLHRYKQSVSLLRRSQENPEEDIDVVSAIRSCRILPEELRRDIFGQ